MIEQGSTGIFAVPAALADDICKNMPQSNREPTTGQLDQLLSGPLKQQQQQNALNESFALNTCIRFVNLSRKTFAVRTTTAPRTHLVLLPSVAATTPHARQINREGEEERQRQLQQPQQRRHKGFKLTKMTRALNFKPPAAAAVFRVGNVLVKFVSTIFLKSTTATSNASVSTIHNVPPT